MKILITNNGLDRRGGAETFVRDMARAFQVRGHRVMVFSSGRERGKRFLDLDAVPVATDLENLEFRPNIIHGMHHLDTMTAVTALPEVPAVYHAHGAVWRDVPPVHPRVYRYFAITPTFKERLKIECNIPDEKIEILMNGADLTRYRTVREAPERPKRALVYHRVHREDGATTMAIREACERQGISLDVIGYGVGRTIENPEEVLLGYDLVFAAGMSAIEAAASGCSVIVLGRTSSGPMLEVENFEHFRTANFSIPEDWPLPSCESVEHEIRKYSTVETAKVSRLMREKADFSEGVETLLARYGEVIELHKQQPEDWPNEVRAISRYLQTIVPLIKIMDNSLTWDVGMPLTMADSLGDLQVQLARFQEQMSKHLKKRTTGVE